ncbi:MAG: amino acid adenylation domain-containing protein, partial [Pseudomonadota bacterium]|nr:amino acid adenylation domain-containing protein [Pseudomonadota bacterium]
MDIQARKDGLSAERRRLLQQRLSGAGRKLAAPAGPTIAVVDRSGELPLSLSQQRLWFIEQLDGASTAYHIADAFRLRGVLNEAAFRRALDRVIERHESLRTRFVAGAEGAVQVIEVASSFALRTLDLSALTPTQQEQAIREHTAQEASERFDLGRGPLIRGRLLRCSGKEHMLLVTMHHIVSDGWSTGVLVGEVSTLYAAYCADLPDPLPALPLQYADYAAWQRQWLQGAVLERQLDYWRGHLQGAPTLLELPSDRPRPALQSYRGGGIEVRLDTALSERLKALGKQHGATLFMVLHAGWAALLSRLSGQSDIVVGVPVANRQRSELEGLIGFFVNTLAFRVRVDGTASVAQLLAQTRETALAGFGHQEMPFEQVVEALQPARTLSYSPVFQTMLVLQNMPRPQAELAGLQLSGEVLESRTAQFDLTLVLQEDEQGIGGLLNYASDLFDGETIERWVSHLTVLLEAMAADAQAEVSALPLLRSEERQQLLETFNATQTAYPEQALVHELFQVQVRRTPQSPALEYAGECWSYGELNERANRLAHALRAQGVGPDARVALCLERGPAMVMAVLAVLKAGGAYVPLDPAYPAERLAYMLQDSAPVRVLVDAASRSRLPEAAQADALEVDADEAFAGWPLSDPDPQGTTARHLAYVIYTSGSTGRPKGVMVEHRSVVNLWQALEQAVFASLPAQARIGLNAALSFDASVQSLSQLLSGRCVVVVPASIRAEGDAMRAFVRERGLAALDCTPSQLELLRFADEEGPEVILVGGEALTRQTWSRLASSRVCYYNVYGPTECTVDASLARISGEVAHIGRPIANTRIHLLDARCEPVPIGVTGELYIGGAGVARGYLNRAELTEARFVADPFRAGERLYRSGDLGRYRRDGTIEFLGRNDDQVKLRGFRIELGEIEACLCACTGVAESAVTVREDTVGDRRLVAYVVAADGFALDVAQLRAQLAQVLAEHMLPGAYVSLPSLPLTANGKVDRRNLPAPDGAAVASRDYQAPEGPVETAIAEIWQTLLGIERVGRDDHFFELGGHSLLAVQVVSRLRQRLGMDVPVRELFAQPTVAALATAAQQAQTNAQPALVPADRAARLPLSWAQQRLWFLDQLDRAAGGAYHMPVALRLSGLLDHAALSATLARIVQRHENLRTRFVVEDGMPWQQVAPASAQWSPIEHDLSALTETEREAAITEWARQEAQAPFDLSQGPMIRARMLRCSAQEHVLLVTMHHIVSDGWSMGVLVGEVSALYAAYGSGQGDPLPGLPIQYADYAVWQRQWLQGAVLERQLDYWRGHLHGAPALLELPGDRPRPAVQSYRGAVVPVRLGAGLTRSLQTLSQRHGTTLYMTLLAGWSALLSRLSGQAEIVVGTPMANRQRAEVEGLIGFFVNTLAFQVRVDGTSSVAELLAQTRETVLSGLGHQDVPFEQVVEALQPARTLSYSPVFQAMLSLNNTPGERSPSLAGLELSVLGQPHTTTHFDLSLSMAEAGGELVGGVEYASDLFDGETIERWVSHLTVLLEAMAADAQAEVSAL